MLNIKYKAPIDASGYSNCAQDYIIALSQKHNIKLIPDKVSFLLDGTGLDFDRKNILQNLVKTEFDSDTYINLCHSVPDRFTIDPNAKLNIGYTVCETEKIPDKWPFLCNKMDAIFTASKYCKEIFEKNGVTKPVFVVPHCHNVKNFSTEEKYNISNLKQFNFLFMADMTPRKGWKNLIEAYCREFNPEDDVSLTLKVYYGDFSKESQEKCKDKIRDFAKSIGYNINQNTAKIFFYGHCLPTNCVNRFINTFDSVVSPHRAEGWALILSQSMLLNKPCIATEYSGNLEFMNKENSFLVPIEETFEKVEEEMIKINPNYAGLTWPKIDNLELRKTLRYVFENQEYAKKIAEKAYKDITESLDYDSISKIIESNIKLLLTEKK